jgi:hypothetical protein
MIAKSDAASIFRGTRGSRLIEISVPGAFTAVGYSGQQKNPGASAAERGRPSLFKTIDEDRRDRHDHINRSGRSTYPRRISVQTSGATHLGPLAMDLARRGGGRRGPQHRLFFGRSRKRTIHEVKTPDPSSGPCAPGSPAPIQISSAHLRRYFRRELSDCIVHDLRILEIWCMRSEWHNQ